MRKTLNITDDIERKTLKVKLIFPYSFSFLAEMQYIKSYRSALRKEDNLLVIFFFLNHL